MSLHPWDIGATCLDPWVFPVPVLALSTCLLPVATPVESALS